MEEARRPGLAEALIVWALFGVVAAAAFVTYARLPPEDLYHTSGTGIEAGASRVLVFLGYPFPSSPSPSPPSRRPACKRAPPLWRLR